MQPYQEEYIANVRQVAELTRQPGRGAASLEAYVARVLDNEALVEAKIGRNMELLRQGLFPVLDNLFEADGAQVEELEAFCTQLFDGRTALDTGLFCQIRQALLTLARQKRDRAAMIRELYWLGRGRNQMCGGLVGLELSDIEQYMTQMRLCFTEAAAYLKYFDEIEDTPTRGYILRSRANVALGRFKSPGEKVHLVKKTLQILQDKEYQKKAPDLPWDSYIYLTHQHMASSISYARDKVMSAQDMADIMESVYIVYQRRIQEAEAQQRQPPVKPAFSYYAIEYYCGIDDLDRLLTKVEDLLDAADPADFSPDGLYAMISLPAFYCQYLQQYPERLPEREEYVAALYEKLLDYLDCIPEEAEDNESLFLYLRQVAYAFVEIEGSISYEVFLQKLLMRLMPELYVHSRSVGEASRAFCRLILDDEPTFFDDIDFVCGLTDREEKRREVEEYAMGCGLFHDVGKINFAQLYARTARQWFEEEYEMAHLHALAGPALLSPRRSTSRYAAAALGHHSWYDGSHGYPEAYRRLECPARQMVDLIGLVDWLENATYMGRKYTGDGRTFEQAVEEAFALEGHQFSPLLTARLRDEGTAACLCAAFDRGRQEAYRLLYEDDMDRQRRKADQEARRAAENG